MSAAPSFGCQGSLSSGLGFVAPSAPAAPAYMMSYAPSYAMSAAPSFGCQGGLSSGLGFVAPSSLPSSGPTIINVSPPATTASATASSVDWLRIIEVGLPIVEKLISRQPAGGGHDTDKRLTDVETAVRLLDLRLSKLEIELGKRPGGVIGNPGDPGKGGRFDVPPGLLSTNEAAPSPRVPPVELFRRMRQLEFGLHDLNHDYMEWETGLAQLDDATKQKWEASPTGKLDRQRLNAVRDYLERRGVRMKKGSD